MFEDTKEIIKSRKSKERQDNGRQKNKPENLQNTTQTIKEQYEPHWKTGDELRYWNRVEHYDT